MKYIPERQPSGRTFRNCLIVPRANIPWYMESCPWEVWMRFTGLSSRYHYGRMKRLYHREKLLQPDCPMRKRCRKGLWCPRPIHGSMPWLLLQQQPLMACGIRPFTVMAPCSGIAGTLDGVLFSGGPCTDGMTGSGRRRPFTPSAK